jgi:hypothetical protein
MVDGVGTTVYTYDQAGQILTEVGPLGSDAMTTNRLRTYKPSAHVNKPSAHVKGSERNGA